MSPSAHTRYIRLRIHPLDGLSVGYPQAMTQHEIVEFLEAKRHWIEKKFRAFKELVGDTLNEGLPDQIMLKATDESILVRYEQTTEHSIICFLKPGEITLCGQVDNHKLCHAALQRWLKTKAKGILIPWLEKLSQETNLNFKSVSIRNQKSRWGSCSSKGNISLNAKLLFFPPELVRYVLLHELCHLKELNHSISFWALVEEFEPEYKIAKIRLGEAQHQIPSWAHP